MPTLNLHIHTKKRLRWRQFFLAFFILWSFNATGFSNVSTKRKAQNVTNIRIDMKENAKKKQFQTENLKRFIGWRLAWVEYEELLRTAHNTHQMNHNYVLWYVFFLQRAKRQTLSDISFYRKKSYDRKSQEKTSFSFVASKLKTTLFIIRIRWQR